MTDVIASTSEPLPSGRHLSIPLRLARQVVFISSACPEYIGKINIGIDHASWWVNQWNYPSECHLSQLKGVDRGELVRKIIDCPAAHHDEQEFYAFRPSCIL